jgi:hypothetical protein
MHLLDYLFLHSHKGSGLVVDFQLIALITNIRFFVHGWIIDDKYIFFIHRCMFRFCLFCDVIMHSTIPKYDMDMGLVSLYI